MTIGRDNLTKAETVAIAAIEDGGPTVAEARELVADFHTMVRSKRAERCRPGSSALQAA